MTCEVLDWSGDTGIKVQAPTLKAAFAEAALCLANLMAPEPHSTCHRQVLAPTPFPLTLQSHSLEGLLVAWLSEALFLFDARGLAAREVSIEILDPENFSLHATLHLSPYEAGEDSEGLLIKAVTYHNLKVQETPEGWTLEVLFDL